jgi:hypothetical protein
VFQTSLGDYPLVSECPPERALELAVPLLGIDIHQLLRSTSRCPDNSGSQLLRSTQIERSTLRLRDNLPVSSSGDSVVSVATSQPEWFYPLREFLYRLTRESQIDKDCAQRF